VNRILGLAVLLLFVDFGVAAGGGLGGHVKAQALVRDYRSGDAGALPAGNHPDLESLESRMNLAWYRGPWDASLQAQLYLLRGDLVAARNDPQQVGAGSGSLPFPDLSDDRQVFDLGWTLSEGGSHLVEGRLDRVALGYTRGPLAVHLGRQATSWGNGLVFQVLDLFDPFPPDALDTEYKPGIDMLAAQWLFPNGDDLQAIVVPRRTNRRGPLAASQSSAALKWRHFAGSLQLELMTARHYRDEVAGFGASGNLAGAVWRWDLATTFRDGGEPVLSSLVNLDRSWTWGGRNVEGYVELYRNGFGATSLDGGVEALPRALLDRLDRGELFNVGRYEAGGGLRLELSPLTRVDPTALVNLEDGSAYLLLQLHRNWSQNLDLDAGAQAPLGPRGTEYGGVRLETFGSYLAPGSTFWFRASRYF
jgi:hypothetical protein